MRTIIRIVAVLASFLPFATISLAQNDAVREIRMTDRSFGTEPKKAVVELSANFMREDPDFAAELGDQALMGTLVEILERRGDWVKIKSPDPYTAWVEGRGLVMMDDKEAEDYLEAPKYICTATMSHVYEEPSYKSRIVSELLPGDLVRIMYKTITHTSGRYRGYEEGRAVLTRKFVGVVLPSGKTGYVPAKDVDVFFRWAKSKDEGTSDGNSLRKELVETAYSFLGVPYMWGGTSIKNVDCSGLTRSVFFMSGILLPRNASQQGRVGEELPLFDAAGAVDWSSLLPGDLVFWGREATDSTAAKATHVGIYIGESRFIHSSFMVRINSLDPSEADYYGRKPLCARRIVGVAGRKDSGVTTIFRCPYYFPQE